VGRTETQRRLGITLVVLGILGVLWGVFYVIGAAGTTPRYGGRFRFDDAKPILQRAFLPGLLRSLVGLAVALAGGRILKHARGRRADGVR
jgi:hypothetical protein